MSQKDLESVERWKNRLNRLNSGWEKGDKKTLKHVGTADLVNDNISFAIELKEERGGTLDNQHNNLITLNNRIQDYFESAGKKFLTYPHYKTLLLVELETSIWSVEVILSGLPRLFFSRDSGVFLGQGIANVGLYSKPNMDAIGGVVFWPAPGSIPILRVPSFFDNPWADGHCKVSHQEAQEIIGEKLKLIVINEAK